jgi:ferredoxin
MPECPSPAPSPDHEVRVPATGAVFRAAPGQTVLQAALIHGVKMPSACRNGTCRACRCRCLEGEVAYQIEWPGLSAEEKRDRWILPCVAQARSDLVLEF